MTVKTFSYLSPEDQWRIPMAYRQLRWLPREIRRYIFQAEYGDDLRQVLALAVFISIIGQLTLLEMGRLIQREVGQFLKSIGVRKRGGRWVIGEYTLFEEQTMLISSNDWWADLIRVHNMKRAMSGNFTHKGKKHSPETKQKIAEALRKRRSPVSVASSSALSGSPNRVWQETMPEGETSPAIV